MYVYALFDNETAELVVIRFLHAAVDKLLDIYLHSFQSPKVQESAKKGILCAYEVIFSEEIKRYYQTSPISVTLKDFNQQVDGSSAGLAYAVAFAAALKDRKIINPPYPMPDKIAATGELDNLGNVIKIKNIKQKITAAINEKANLILYPSQNYNELKYMRQSDPEFDNAIKESGIILKHVSTLKQAFCELGIFPNPTICIEPVKSPHTNILTLAISLYNDIHMDIKSFSLLIKYNNSLQLGKIYESNLSKTNRNIKCSIDNDNKLLLSFSTENDIFNVLNESTQLLEISLLPIGSFSEEKEFEIKFEESYCTINCDPYEGIGGISLKSSMSSFHNKHFVENQIPQGKKNTNFIKRHKNTLLMSGVLLASLSVLIHTYGVFKSWETKVVDATISPTPDVTTDLNSTKTSPSLVVETILTPVPTVVTSPISTPTAENITTPTSVDSAAPTLINMITPTSIQKTNASTKPSIIKKSSTEFLSPTPDIKPVALNPVDDFTSWIKKDTSNQSKLSSEEGFMTDKAVRIDYNIKVDGYVFIKTKPEAVSISPNKYKKLSFYYKCVSEESCTDIVNIKIYSSNGPKTFNIGSTEEISNKNQWLEKEIDISKFKDITSIELFIGITSIDTSVNTVDKGSFLLCNFRLSP